MTLLVISPDYASHVLPLLAIAGAWRHRGQRVVVATGPAVAPLVRDAGMEHTALVMSRGSNAGMLRTRAGIDDDARALAAFFEATRAGLTDTLRFQAAQRARDSLWRPHQVARRTARLVERYRPDVILIDHLAFAASIGLRAIGARYGDVVVGHPTALPVRGELYGLPTTWPPAVSPDPVGLEALRVEAGRVSQAFTHAYNDALHALAPAAPPVDDAFAVHGDLVLFNYPSELHPPERTARLPAHVFLGSSVRSESPDEETRRWLARTDDRPLVVVSFGTFLSARTDVLAKVVAALRRLDVRVALAIGASDGVTLGELPPAWLVRHTCPRWPCWSTPTCSSPTAVTTR